MKYILLLFIYSISLGQTNTEISILDSFDQIKTIKEENYYLAWSIPGEGDGRHHTTSYSTSDESRIINFEDLASNSDQTIILLSFEDDGEELNSTNIMPPKEYYLFKKQKFYWLGEQKENISYRFAMDLYKTIENKKRIFPILNSHSNKSETLEFYKKTFEDSNEDKFKESLVFWIGQLGLEASADYLFSLLKSKQSLKIREKVVFALHTNETDKANKYLTDIVFSSDYDDRIREKAIFWKSQNDKMSIDEMMDLLNTVDSSKLQEKVIFGISQLKDKKKNDALLEIAGDSKYSTKIREKALFWFGQSDDVDITRLKALYEDTDDIKLKEKIIFSISQKDDTEATNVLLSIAKNRDDSSKLREKAIFWLSQRETDNLKAIFEDLIKSLEIAKLREKVIFAIYNSSIEDSKKMLYDIAVNKNEELKLREKAIFWLGQKQSVSELKMLYLQVESIKLKEKLIFSFHQNASDEATDFMVNLLKLSTTETKIKKKIVFWLGQSGSDKAKDAIADLID